MRLYLKPTSFFTSDLALARPPYLVFVLLICGVSYAVGRIDKQMMKAELGAGSQNPLVGGLVDSWLPFWAFVVAIGLLSGLILWGIGGWWYRVRLKWSGAQGPDPKTARIVYIYSSFVYALPAVLVVLVATVVYDSYRQYWSSDELFSSAVLIFVFWSCVTSYKGAMATFSLVRWRGRLWFFFLPVGIYFLAFVGLALLYALAG